jgi:glycosyltransferase involved in cell wall biosynthesis
MAPLIAGDSSIFMMLNTEQNRIKSMDNTERIGEGHGAVSVIIAARNEEQAIANTLYCLLTQLSIAEIIVVDDHSTDKTSEVVSEVSQNNPIVKLIQAPPVPDGWTGKNHALYIGSQAAISEFILFTDADVVFSGNIIEKVARRMHKEGLDHVGGMFGLKCRTISEKISAPVLASVGYFSMSLTAGKVGAGTGAFNLVRRTAYEKAGGHTAIYDCIVDDIALARLMKRNAYKTLFLRETSPYVQVRLFEGWKGFWNAIARSSVPFLNMGKALVSLMAFMFLILAISLMIAPFFAIYFLWEAFMAGVMLSWIIGIILFLYYFAFYVFIYSQKNYCETRWFWVSFYPIAFTIMVISVMFASIRMFVNPSLVWRGRHYKVVR